MHNQLIKFLYSLFLLRYYVTCREDELKETDLFTLDPAKEGVFRRDDIGGNFTSSMTGNPYPVGNGSCESEFDFSSCFKKINDLKIAWKMVFSVFSRRFEEPKWSLKIVQRSCQNLLLQ